MDPLCHRLGTTFATPIIGITLLMIVAERTLHIGFFDPTLGGDPLLYQHLILDIQPSCRIHNDLTCHGGNF